MKYFYTGRESKKTLVTVAICKVFENPTADEKQAIREAFINQLNSEGIKFDYLSLEWHPNSLGTPSLYYVAGALRYEESCNINPSDMPKCVKEWA